MEDRNLVIIGNGIAGVTAARHVRKRSNMPITIISSESKYFFSRTALMYIYMGHMKFEHTKPYEDEFWKKNSIDLIQDKVVQLNANDHSLSLQNGGSISYTDLIIATGSKTATYDWSGIDLKGVQGLYSLQDLQLMEENTIGIKNAVIVGGGLIGVEMAEMLHSRGIHVTFLVRESRFWGNVLPKEEGEMVAQCMESAGIDLQYSTELDSIQGNEEGKVRSVKTKDGQLIDCEFVGITTGVRPNVDFLKGSNIELDRGVLVDDQLRTNMPSVYAVGDCAQLRKAGTGRRPTEAVWYVGKMMGEVVAASICGQATNYQPGPWFNSAKFFELEYQTYGHVSAEEKEDESSLLWQDQANGRLLRLSYDPNTSSLKGINALGIRLSHTQCDHWLRKEIKIHQLLPELSKADFNPEFHQIPFKEIRMEMEDQLNALQL